MTARPQRRGARSPEKVMAEQTVNANYVFIDYENVQPKNIGLLADKSCRVKLFLGPHQAKLPTSMVTDLHSLGNRLEYVRVETHGSNALDFHIAYYLGQLSREKPATFHIISKDKGFDPLVEHLRKKGVSVERCSSIADMAIFKSPHRLATKELFKLVVDNLAKRKSARPRTPKALRSTVQALCKSPISEQELSDLMAALRKEGVVKVEGDKVSYNLTAEPR